MVKDLPENETIYLNDLPDLELTFDEIKILKMVYNASPEVSMMLDDGETYVFIALEFAIRILTQFDATRLSERGRIVLKSLLDELVHEQIKLNEKNDDGGGELLISYQDLILKIQNDMEELGGEDLAEFAGHIGINVKYQDDSIFVLN